jgi:hypothetical protein
MRSHTDARSRLRSLTKLSAGLKDWLGRERKELFGEFVSACRIGRFGREKHLDRALPQRHTKQLYDSLSYDGTKILAQLRTGKCRLNSYLYRINPKGGRDVVVVANS